ncbi:hypothetical protein PTSG_11612 [Salpingoeca rosetta]|uniref:non-specific serine/threonine protein kinase n=1 Tax=Salpingoeca rosetta (strain ATCC 50818 / BSB-021) TaxID=946362 RepID=F2TWV0_SALR5|nr:uncharacterized protein PTSG_11612 [Salpingoeca rosetta]EGD72546.1 hypothetical protein PTSG_11612 [Salpingoeca rosetta]|eukprot:XP_004999115.1 hypothetical protein PTSG_11612 [Salpingoeca rosetta]
MSTTDKSSKGGETKEHPVVSHAPTTSLAKDEKDEKEDAVRKALAEAPHLKQRDKELIEAIANGSCAARISLEGASLGPTGAGALAVALSVNTNLERLNLDNNTLGPQGAARVADAIATHTSLQWLSLFNNDIGDEGAGSFAAALQQNNSLYVIRLNCNNIGPDGGRALGTAMEKNSKLTQITLWGNSIDAIREFGAALPPERMMQCNDLSNDERDALDDAREEKRTHHLNWDNLGAMLKQQSLKPKTRRSIQAIAKNNCAAADLNYTPLHTQGARVLALALRDSGRLQELELDGTRLGPTGAAILAAALKHHTSLLRLSLQSANVQDEGAMAIAGALRKNNTLERILLGSNYISRPGANALANAMKTNTSLKVMFVDRNRIGDKGAIAFARALQDNSTLSHLLLYENRITANGGRTLGLALHTNKTLQQLSLQGNGKETAAAFGRALPPNRQVVIEFAAEELNAYKNARAQTMTEGPEQQIADLEKALSESDLNEATMSKLRSISANTCNAAVFFDGVRLGEPEAKALAQALKANTCIVNLDLDNTHLGDTGVIALADAIANHPRLRWVSLYKNNIGDDGAVAFARAIQTSTSLCSARINCNHVGAAGGRALAEAMNANKSFTHITMWGNSVEAVRAFGTALSDEREIECEGLSEEERKAFWEARTGKGHQEETTTMTVQTQADAKPQPSGTHADTASLPQPQDHSSNEGGQQQQTKSSVETDLLPSNQHEKEQQPAVHEQSEPQHPEPAQVQTVQPKQEQQQGAEGQGQEEGQGGQEQEAEERQQEEDETQQQQQQQQPVDNGGNAPNDNGDIDNNNDSSDVSAAQDVEKQKQQQREAEVMAAMRQIAENSDAQTAGRAKLMLVGEGRAGKTTTLNSLMGKKFNMHEHSTLGADSMDMSVSVETMEVFNWQHLRSDLSEYMRSLLSTALARMSGMDASMQVTMKKAMKEHQQRLKQQQQVKDDDDDDDEEDEDRAVPQLSKQRRLLSNEQSGHGGGDEGHPNAPAWLGRRGLPDNSEVHPDPFLHGRGDPSMSSPPSPLPSRAGLRSNVPAPSNEAQAASFTTSSSKHALVTTAAPGMSAEDIEKAIKEFNVDAVMGEGKARVTFKIFDLGGQSTFYIFHPFFLTKYAVYLLVFSMEDLLHQAESKRAESWEFMEHWLSSLHLHAKGAPVLIVGTFADVVSQRKQHENISRDIHSRLRHNPAFPSVVYNYKHNLWLWPVDNTKSIHDPMIQDLRQTISSTALAQEYVSQEVAVPYLHLYDKLHAIARDEKRLLLTFDEVVQIAHTCGLRTRQETRACLQFLHLYSMVLYYDSVPGMEDFVILSPQWAVDMMTRVIRNFDLHRDVRDGEARAIGAQLWDDLVDRGILHRRLLDVLWRDVDSNLIDPFLRLMMEYGLCIQYTAPMVLLPGPQQQQQHHQQYLVPAILPMTLEDEQASSVTLSTAAAKQINCYVGYEEKTVYVAFCLEGLKRGTSAQLADLQRASFLPEGLFAMVLARVMAHMQHGATEPPMLSRTDAVIFMDAAEIELQLVPDVGGIKVKITNARPRTLLHMLYDTITAAAKQRYPDLKAKLLVPYDESTLLFFEDVLLHHTNKRVLRVGRSDLLPPDDLVAKYGPLLPILGLQDKYDVFISYRQRGNRGLALALHPKLEHHGLVAFMDANNLETGLNFKHACIQAIQHSVVASPVVSVAAIHQMRSLDYDDACDNVLLEWMAMLELQQLVHQQSDKIRLRRIVPLFLGSGWHDSSSHAMSAAEVSEYDSFDRMKRLATKLPDVVSEKTAAALDEYFTHVLHMPPPRQHKSVREVVLSLFDVDGVVSFQSEHDRAADAARMAEHVRRAVAACNASSAAGQHMAQLQHQTPQPIPALMPVTPTSPIASVAQSSSPTTISSPAALLSATPSPSFLPSSPLEPALTAWLQQHSLLPHVESALVEHGIDSLEVLVEAVIEGDLTKHLLKEAGVKIGPAIKLMQAAKAYNADGMA